MMMKVVGVQGGNGDHGDGVGGGPGYGAADDDDDGFLFPRSSL